MTQQEVYDLIVKNGGKLQKVFTFGKIKYSKRKENLVEVEMELTALDKVRIQFTACGLIWNRTQTDCLQAGQCLDTINEYVQSPLFKTIYSLWKKYHLNTLHAGTKEQEAFLDNYFSDKEEKWEYEKACQVLKDNNLYEVEYEGKPYKYGHGWLYEAIPDEDLNTIVNLFFEKFKW